MKSDKARSDSNTAGTSARLPPPADQSDADFLQAHGEAALQAMRQALRDAADSFVQGVNPTTYARTHPWSTMTAFAAVGFLAASALTPSRKESLAERWKSLFPKEEEDEVEVVAVERTKEKQKEKKKSSMLGSLLGPVGGALKAALASSISAAIAANVGQGDGQGDAEKHGVAQGQAHAVTQSEAE